MEQNLSALQELLPGDLASRVSLLEHSESRWLTEPMMHLRELVSKEQERDLYTPGSPDAINTACSVNHGSVDYSARALSHWVDRFLRTGELPPSAPRVLRT